MKQVYPFLLALALTAACAGNPLRPDPALGDEVRQLQQRIVELQREARMNEVEIARLRQQVAELEARGGGRPSSVPVPSSPVRTPAAGTRTPTPAPQAAPQAVAPSRPVTPVPSAPVAQRPVATPPPVVTRPAAPVPAPHEAIEEEDLDVPQQTAPVRPAAPAPAPAAPAPGDDSELLSLSAQALYDRGYTLYHQGRFVDSEASFQRFLQTNPDSELADNAQYWIGECRYARNDSRGALAAFREVIEKHPKGNKVPDALLKAGQCLEAMGDVEGARVTYREVGRRFPGTAAATVAEERRTKLP